MDLGCARCGACCAVLTITLDRTGDLARWSTAALEHVPDPREDWTYWQNHGWSDDQRPEAEAWYDPKGNLRPTADFLAEHWREIDDHPGNYRCDRWDPETLLCTAHEDRPPVCSSFPWYGEGPSVDRARSLDPQCSYLLQVSPGHRPEGARPLIPIEVVKR